MKNEKCHVPAFFSSSQFPLWNCSRKSYKNDQRLVDFHFFCQTFSAKTFYDFFLWKFVQEGEVEGEKRMNDERFSSSHTKVQLVIARGCPAPNLFTIPSSCYADM